MDHDRSISAKEYEAKSIGTDEKRITHQEIPIYNDLERITETEISLGKILKGTSATPLTTFEKKAALVNAELDKFGLGKYQICIWFLCGFGYFLDLAWAQGVGVMASAIYQEMGVPSTAYGNIWSCANAGLAVGAFGWGILVDIVGRRWAFNLTCLITSVFGLLLVSPFFTKIREKLLITPLFRPHQSIITERSAPSISFRVLDSAAISRSTQR